MSTNDSSHGGITAAGAVPSRGSACTMTVASSSDPAMPVAVPVAAAGTAAAAPPAALSLTHPIVSSSSSSVVPSPVSSASPLCVKSSNRNLNGTRGERAFWLLCTILSCAMGLYALQYWGAEFFVPDNIAANRYKTGWLVLHATGASAALLLAPAQFVTSLRRQYPKWHRYMGRAYAFAIACSSIAAMVLSIGVSTGPVSAVGFFLLASCWIFTTTMGVVQARRGYFPSHRQWMIRSFALALSAVTLRMYIPIGIRITGGDFDRAYRGIAWACWVPNLVAAELYIRTEIYRQHKQRRTPVGGTHKPRVGEA